MKRTQKKIYLSALFFFTVILISCSKENGTENPPQEKPPLTEIDVLTFRKANTDHQMIQRTIDYAAANQIGTVTIPDGEYEIDAAKSIELRDNIHLKLSDNAILKALPNNLEWHNVLKVWKVGNVKISGGKIVGERYEHQGTKGEWGMGIDLRYATNVEISNIHISDCWGDGIHLFYDNKNITIQNVVCDNNRRQGMSVIHVNGLIVKNSVFSNTNGTAPESGIDLEPSAFYEIVKNVLIDNCTFSNNKEIGLHIYGEFGIVEDIKVTNCIVENSTVGVSLYHSNVYSIEMSDIKISDSKSQALRIYGGSKDVEMSRITIEKSASNGITLSEAANVALSDFTVNDYYEGLSVSNSTNIKISSSSFQTSKPIAIGANIKGSKEVELSKLEIEGGKIGISSTKTEKLTLSGNILRKQTETGLYLSDTHSAEVKGNNLSEIAQTPVNVENSNSNKINNNTFIDNFSKDNTYSQVLFDGNSRNNELKGNTISKGDSPNRAAYAVWLRSATESNTISGNTIQKESYGNAEFKDESGKNQIEQ
ncbi:MAG TPA: hypothetical protein DDZ96_10010 [Porphyromonadaceae bacterium]|jgi:hypothetical protein|nr:hypothetical protein [Porphyromonadaceae bacterium]HBL34132.1 hypothetical protein [Porphyromonadaceae bacterium]HBX19773.1 hypothetical protein [Porphyromonadaceae bacterium]HCM19412.1 hypothetical protein [Porphyromonadaceae bacterium]